MSDEKEYFTEFPKWLRLTVLPWYLWVLIVVVAIWATKAYAEEVPLYVFEDEAVSLSLFSGPCENETANAAAQNTPLKGLKLQKAASVWVVQSPVGLLRIGYAGCWAELNYRGRQGYAVAFEDGEVRFFPAEGFKKTKGGTGV